MFLFKSPRSKLYHSDHPFVAVKVLQNPNDSAAEHEAKLLSTLKHESIVQYLDMLVDVNSQNLCLIMEYCNYGTLQDWITRNGKKKGTLFFNSYKNNSIFKKGRLREGEAWSTLYQLSSALSYLHNLHPPIIHRDLKPANILMKKEEDTGYLKFKIADFGIAKILGEKKCHDIYYTRSQAGTEIYLAPEVIRGGQVTTSADIFSLGAVMSFTCNRGTRLFQNHLQISSWQGNKSTLNREKYSLTFRQMIANMLSPAGLNRPDAKQLKVTSFHNSTSPALVAMKLVNFLMLQANRQV